MRDTSIQANLREHALRKGPSHRNWREWYAICDHLEDTIVKMEGDLRYLKTARWGFAMFGVSAGLIISYLIQAYASI